MKHLLFLFSLLCATTPKDSPANITDTFDTIIYDSLTNIGYLNETESSIKKYIGQELIFLDRSKMNVPQYYANFNYEEPVVVDTTWIKIRKNKKKIKAEDYKLIRTTSYDPTYVKDEVVVLAGASDYHYQRDAITSLFSYWKDNDSYNPRRSGYYTHFSSIEGKTFRILDVKLEEVESMFKTFIFKLQSTDDQILYWTAECNTMQYKKIAYPVIVKGYLDKMKELYLHKDFYFKSTKYEGEKYFCSDIIFRRDDSDYLVPYIQLDNKENDTRYLRLMNVPQLFDSEICLNQGLIIEPDLLVEANVFESEKERYELEQKAIAEQIILEQKAIAEQIIKEKKEREAYILKKYGNYYGKLILNNRIRIGMNKNMVLESWGNPNDINRTISSYGVHEQWCYDDAYLYFEDGKLTTIQD